MGKIDTILEHAEQHCAQHGARLTVKRKQVLAGLLQSTKALSAYELADYCNAEFGESMPIMSIYRILSFLQEENLVHKLNLANKYVACAHITCKHEHEVSQFLICGHCQVVKEITINKSIINELKGNVEQAGFFMASPQLEMTCICQACMKQAE